MTFKDEIGWRDSDTEGSLLVKEHGIENVVIDSEEIGAMTKDAVDAAVYRLEKRGVRCSTMKMHIRTRSGLMPVITGWRLRKAGE